MNIKTFYKWSLIAMAILLPVGILTHYRTLLLAFDIILVTFAVVFFIMTITDLINWYKTKNSKNKK